MAEPFSWTEGSIYLWSGSTTASASALVGYATDSTVTLMKGWDTQQTLTGTYLNNKTGQRADMTIGALYMTDNSGITTLFDSETAVHIHIRHSAIVGPSAGVFLWSGRLDTLNFNGTEGQLYQMSVTYHANLWSAYG